MERIRFFKELGAIAFERAYLEEVNEQLLINEEQNRIANEIHDSVLQKLFSVSCGIFGLMKNIEKLDESKVKEELNTIRDSIDSAMKELRHTIYGLSWEKDGINSFEEDIFEYINQTKKLNNADITFDVTGNMEFLSLIQKKAIYRIICEGIGNAVHHGKADHISVNLNIEPKNSLLRITDNGKGFNTNGIKNNKGSGLGIKNLYYLTESLNGEINITSKTGIGTEININIPNNIMVIERKNAV
jgi:signal transduction histidine kinase